MTQSEVRGEKCEVRTVGLAVYRFFKVSFVAFLTLCALHSAFSITEGSVSPSPYQAIVDRNVFGLKPPPPPAPPPNPEANKPPPPTLTLTGITTILNSKRAFMSYTLPPKPPEPPKTISLMLSEGQRDGDIEVLEIDIAAGTVKVNDFGTITNLSWDKNGIKTASSGGGGNPVPTPTGVIPTPGQNPGNPFGQRTIPSRQLRLPGAPVPPAPSASATEAGGTPSVATPGGNLSFGGNTAVPQPQNQQPQLSREEQEILLEANHQQAVSKGDPVAGVFPPGVLNPTRNTTQPPPQQNEQPGQNQTSTLPRPLPGRPLPPY